MSLWGAITGHANIIVHAAGWLEGGLTASFEKLIVDAEMLQMMAEYLQLSVTSKPGRKAGQSIPRHVPTGSGSSCSRNINNPAGSGD